MLRIFLLTFVLVTAPIFSIEAVASSNSAPPIMVIRFNQPRIHYKETLFRVVDEALQVKPNTIFTVTTIVPAESKSKLRNAWEKIANKNANILINALRSKGIADSFIRKAFRVSNQLDTMEAHIFVE